MLNLRRSDWRALRWTEDHDMIGMGASFLEQSWLKFRRGKEHLYMLESETRKFWDSDEQLRSLATKLASRTE